MRAHIALAISVFALIGLIGANAAEEVPESSSADRRDNAFWIKTKLPDELLAGRLNVTTISKSLASRSPAQMPRPQRVPQRPAKTARLMR